MDVDEGRPNAWIELGPRTAVVLLADLFVITAVLAVGLRTHGVDPSASIRYTVVTVLPFLAGWMLVAPVVGAYSRAVRTRLRRVVPIVTAAWIGAVLVGAGIRVVGPGGGGASGPFVLVLIGSGLVGLLPWRVAVVLAEARVGR